MFMLDLIHFFLHTYIHTYINNAYYSAFPQLIKALYNTKIDRIKYKAKMQTRNTSKKSKMNMAQKNYLTLRAVERVTLLRILFGMHPY